MESNKDCKLICEKCEKKYSSVSAKNRHIKEVHKELINPKTSSRIICPLCHKEEKFSCYDLLTEHLTIIHNLNLTKSVLNFRNIEEFEVWRSMNNREVDYVCQRTNISSREKVITYICNRSDYKGFVSVCKKRSQRSKGSIRIQGICPSRIVVKISNDGIAKVTFVETHVGHTDELRSKRLSISEQQLIVSKLIAGISSERIIEDARMIEGDNLKRINVVTKGDLAYLIRKFNIDRKRDEDDMVFTKEKETKEYPKSVIDSKRKREIEIEEMCNEIRCYCKDLNESEFNKFKEDFGRFKHIVGIADKNGEVTKKIKIEK